MMTLAALMNVYQDRVNRYTENYLELTDKMPVDRHPSYLEGYLEGQLDEARIALNFVNKLDRECHEREQYPLRIVPSITFNPDPFASSAGEMDERTVISEIRRWGEQERHNWPDTTLNEAEPGKDRHDPERC